MKTRSSARRSPGPASAATIVLLGVVLLGVVLLGACAPADDRAGSRSSTSAASSATERGTDPLAAPTLPVPVQELDIDATDYTFAITPDPSKGLEPGWTLVRFHNVGAEAHQVMFARPKPGVDMAELAKAAAGDSSGAAAIEYVDMIGGVSYIAANHDITAMVDLPEGLVVAMCYVPDAKGVAHALLGMSSAFTVSAPSSDATAAPRRSGEEQVLGTIELADDGYRIPDDLRRGWYQVKNTSPDLHELSLMRLSAPVEERRIDALVQDLAANRTPQVQLEAVGGMGAISPGFEGYLHLDLQPGHYLAVDFMPDPGVPRPHLLDGYHATFRV